ncbi:MAG TPA: PAS domain S-box protein, partial [Syntrophales bacterium]|nr:PAS domain S-box protein [Syntrophales bacterium]
MKLQAKLLILYAISTVVILIIFGEILYSRLWEKNLRTVQKDIITDLYQTDRYVNTFFTEVENDINALVANEVIRSRDDHDFTNFLTADGTLFEYHIGKREQKVIDILYTFCVTHPYVNTAYMGRENGSFIRSHKKKRPPRYDPRERPWYILAKKNPDRIVTIDAYRAISTPDVKIGLSKALVDEQGLFYGAVGLDVTLEQLTTYVTTFKTNPPGKVLLIDGKGLILADLDNDMLFKNIREYSSDLSRIFAKSKPEIASVTIQNKRHYALCIDSTEHNWKIATLIPSENIEKRVTDQIALAISGLSIGIVLLSILTLIGLDIYVVRPLIKFTKETDSIIETSDLDHRIDIHSHDEIGSLARSYNRMLDTISQTEEALSSSEKKYRDIFENAPMGIYQTTPEGRFRSVNPAFATLFGYETPEALIESNHDIQKDFYVHPEERDKIQKLFVEQGVVTGFEAEFRRLDGSQLWLSVTGKAVHDDNGRLLYYEGMVEDITDRQKAERELAVYHEHLEELVADRTAELEVAKENAEAADR